jgi:tetratricopeptide repeat protein
MFVKVIHLMKVRTNLCKVVLTIVLLGGSLGLHAEDYDSLQSYNYFFLEGVRQQEMGNLTAAFDLLRHARDLNPNAPEVYYLLAPYYVDLKDDTRSRAYYERAATLDPENSSYIEKLGQLYVSQKDYPNAINAYEKLYALNKARVDVLQILYQLYGSQNEFQQMINVLNRIEVLEGGSEQISLSKMQIYEQMGEKRKEYDELKSLVDSHPLDLNYKVMFGNWLLQNGKKKEAVKLYRNVLKEEPTNALAKLSLLDYYRTIGDQATVDVITQELLQSPKTEKETKIALLRQVISSNQQANVSDSAEVMKLFSQALSVPQTDADILMMKAAYMSLKKMPKAEINRVYEQAIDVEPDNSRARIALIQNIWDTGDYDKVIAICRPAQEYNPEEMVFYYFQGMAQYQKHENDAALQTFRKGVSQIKADSNPDVVSDFYALMGEILHEKGRLAESFQAYDSCLQWKPDNIAAMNNYAYYLSEANKDLPKAEQLSYKTIKAEPNNSTFLDTYAWILFQQKRYEEAKIYIDQAIRSDSTLTGVVKEHAGDIYAMTGDIDKALEFWQQSLKGGNQSAVLKKKIQLKKYVAK